MTAITLRSASGKWKLKTTVDDPYFASILGAMAGEGLDLPDELVIEGTLGEALEREWKYIELLKLWFDWEEYVEERTRHLLEEGRTDVWKGVIGSKVIEDIPNDVVRLQDIPILSTALSLPDGWESFVIVDEETLLQQRIHHMEASLDYMRKNEAFRALSRMLYNTQVEKLADYVHDPLASHSSLLDPFLRNVWLRMRRENPASDGYRPPTFLDIPTVLSLLDWEGVKATELPPMIVNGKGGTDVTLVTLVKLMTEVQHIPYVDYTVRLNVRMIGELEFLGFHYTDHTSHSLPIIYKRLLDNLPDDATTRDLGLGSILGAWKLSVWESAPSNNDVSSSHNVYIANIVPWVNSVTIAYLRWYMEKLNHQNALHQDHAMKGVIRIARTDFPEIVQFLGETLGLHVMRRMLLLASLRCRVW